MKKIYILIFLLFFVFSFSHSLAPVKPKFKMIIDGNYQPLYYVPSYLMYGSGFEVSLMLGLTLNNFALGIETYNKYSSYNGRENFLGTNGAINTMKFSLNFYFKVVRWIELSWGLGGFWFQSSFQEENSGWITAALPGATVLFDVYFYMPWEYFEIKLINKLDLVLDVKNENPSNIVTPLYTGGLKFVFHPYIKWLDFYIETSAMPFYYKNDVIQFGNTLFIGSVGLSFDLAFPFEKEVKTKNILKKDIVSNIKETQKEEVKEVKNAELKKEEVKEVKKEQIIEEKIVVKNEDKIQETQNIKTENTETQLKNTEIKIDEIKKTVNTEKAEQNKNLVKLENAKIGDIIVFTEIVFIPKTNSLKPDSYDILNKITEIIRKRKLKVSITGYSEFVGNPLYELELAQKRAEVIKEYIGSKGIKIENLKVKQSGTLFYENKKDDKPRTIFEILVIL